MNDELVTRERYAMGTVFRVVARADAVDGERRGRGVDASLDEVARLDAVLSHYDPGSEVSRLSRQGPGGRVAVSSDLYDALSRSVAMTRLSGGRFDVTVGPLVRIWRRADATGETPARADIDRAAECVGPDTFTLEPPHFVRLHVACLDLDFGGIGKGLAVDRAVAVLQAHGVEHAIVNAGGSTMRAVGSASDGPGWPVQTAAVSSGLLRLTDASLSTSVPSPELIAPGQRTPVSASTTVTVVAPDGATADALSTALLLSTVEQARVMLGHVPGAFASWTDRDGNMVAHVGPDVPGAEHRAGGTR